MVRSLRFWTQVGEQACLTFAWGWLWQYYNCNFNLNHNYNCNLMFQIMEKTYFLVWWNMTNLLPQHAKMWENMATLVCNTSLPKVTDQISKRKTFGCKFCKSCDLGIIRNARHLVRRCPFFDDSRIDMNGEMRTLCGSSYDGIMVRSQDLSYILKRKHPFFEMMIHLWLVSGKHISLIKNR